MKLKEIISRGLKFIHLRDVLRTNVADNTDVDRYQGIMTQWSKQGIQKHSIMKFYEI